MKIKTFHTWATHITLSAQFGGHGSSNYHFMGAECSQVHTSGVHISISPSTISEYQGYRWPPLYQPPSESQEYHLPPTHTATVSGEEVITGSGFKRNIR